MSGQGEESLCIEGADEDNRHWLPDQSVWRELGEAAREVGRGQIISSSLAM